jgi:uncharacterized membrane protein
MGNVWVLGALFSPDGSIDGERRTVLIAFVQAVCVFGGAALLWTRPPRAVRERIPNWAAATAVVIASAAAVVGTGWGIWAYRSVHHHTSLVEGAHAPTAEERQWADAFIQRSLDSAIRHGWFDFANAEKQGFEKQWEDRSHYFKREHLFDDEILDPDRPEFLMYKDTPSGKLLVGFMYYGRTTEEHGPQPGGTIATWHFHPWGPRGYCAERGLLVVSRPDDKGSCAVGVHVTRSAEMLHVWFIDHPLGPYADAMVLNTGARGLNVTHLHPIAVHFTVALFVVALLLDLAGLLTGRQALHATASMNMIIAGLSSIVTIAAGMAAEVNLMISHDVHAVLDTHKLLGFTGFGGMLLLAVWRVAAGGGFPARAGMVHALAATATAGVVLAAGYVGSQLVYDDGLAVQAIDRMAIERLERTVFSGQHPVAPGTGQPVHPVPAGADSPHGGHQMHGAR